MKKILFLSLLLVVFSASIAFAEPVEDFSIRIKDSARDGSYSIALSSRAYDTTGGQPPLLTGYTMRLPAGITFNKLALGKQYQCDSKLLIDSLVLTPEPSRAFSKRVEGLKATLARVRKRTGDDGKPLLNAAAIRNFETCIRARLGRGTVQVDVRPILPDLIPVKLFMFMGKKSDKGAFAAFGSIGIPDESSPIVAGNALLLNTRPAFTLNMFREVTPDGAYGYRMVLPAGKFQGISLTLAELNTTLTGFRTERKTTKCLKRKGGRCVQKKVTTTKAFWLNKPTCPDSGKLSFLARYEYETGLINERVTGLPCPKFG